MAADKGRTNKLIHPRLTSPTLAELYRSQGHPELARRILENSTTQDAPLLDREPEDRQAAQARDRKIRLLGRLLDRVIERRRDQG